MHFIVSMLTTKIKYLVVWPQNIPNVSSSPKAVTESLIKSKQSRHFSSSWLTDEYFWKNFLRSFSSSSVLAGEDACVKHNGTHVHNTMKKLLYNNPGYIVIQ